MMALRKERILLMLRGGAVSKCSQTSSLAHLYLQGTTYMQPGVGRSIMYCVCLILTWFVRQGSVYSVKYQ